MYINNLLIYWSVSIFSITGIRYSYYQQIQFSSFSECKNIQTSQYLKKKVEFKKCNYYFTFIHLTELGLFSGGLIISTFEKDNRAVENDKALASNFQLKNSIFILTNAHWEHFLALMISILRSCGDSWLLGNCFVIVLPQF